MTRRLLIAYYRILLWAYPHDFRRDVGADAARLFAEASLNSQKTLGWRAILRRILRAAWDVPVGGLALRLAQSSRGTVEAPLRSWSLVLNMARDLRCSVRGLWLGQAFRKSKVFAAAAVLTVAVGVGLNSVVLSLFDRLLFRPLPFSEPERLVQIYSRPHPSGSRAMNVNVLLELARLRDLFSGIAWVENRDLESVTPSQGDSSPLWLKSVTTNTLDVLGLRPVIGPGFAGYPATDLDRPVLLTYQAWQQRYGCSPDVLSLSWTVRDRSQAVVQWRVVGVLPRDFVLPSSAMTGDFDGIFGRDPRFNRRLSAPTVGAAAFARLAPGMPLWIARARVSAFVESQFSRLGEGAPAGDQDHVTVVPLQTGLATTARSYVWLVAFGAWAVLGCTGLTLAVLLLTWTQGRQQDASLHLALGASPRSLALRGLAEASLLCGVGAAIGWIAYTAGRHVFVSALPPTLQAYASETTDLRVIVITVGIALFLAVAVGTLPALRTSRASPLDVLRAQPRMTGADRLIGGPVLLAVQAAFGMVLLVGAAATVPGILNDLSTSPGFTATDLHFVRVPTASDRTAGDAVEQLRRGREALDIARRLPGVVAASLSLKDPLWATPIEAQFLGRSRNGFAFPGRVLPVDSDSFAALGTRILMGRTFSSAEVEQQAMVAIVNEAATAVVGAGSSQSAVGRTLETEDGRRVIVGVVEDFRLKVGEAATPSLFLPLTADEAYRSARTNPYPTASFHLVLRTSPGQEPDLIQLSDELRTRPWMSPRWVGASSESVAARIGVDLQVPRLLALIFGTLGGVVLLLQLVAIAGLAIFEIGRRREEITVRLALGATAAALRRRLAVGIVRPIVVGVCVGVPLSWFMTTFLARSVSTVDPGSVRLYLAAAGAMIVVALITAWVPGWRSITLRVSELLRT